MIGVAGDFQNALHVGLIRDLNTRVQCVLYFSFEQSTLGAGEMSDSTAGTTMVTSRSGTMATAGTTPTMGTVSDPMAMAGTTPTMGTEVNSMFWNDGDGWDEPTISGTMPSTQLSMFDSTMSTVFEPTHVPSGLSDWTDLVVHVGFNDAHSPRADARALGVVRLGRFGLHFLKNNLSETAKAVETAKNQY